MNLIDNLFCEDTQDGAYYGLLALMTGISEEFWAAGWMSGLEYALWQVEAGREYGMGVISERQATLLRLLSEEAGGWWGWQDGPKFFSKDSWLEHLKTIRKDS